MELFDLLNFFCFGIAVGVLGACLGIGGGIIIIPFLLVFKETPYLNTIATSHLIIVGNSLLVSLKKFKIKQLPLTLCVSLEPIVLAGAYVGVCLAGFFAPPVVSSFFAVLCTLMTFTMIKKFREAHHPTVKNFDNSLPNQASRSNLLKLYASLFITAIIAAILGIGGGVVLVPQLIHWAQLPFHAATAVSSFLSGSISIWTSLSLYQYIDLYFALPCIFGVQAGVSLGSKINERLDTKYFYLALAGLLVFTAVKLIDKIF